MSGTRKTALVTGGSQGIGFAVAERLVKRGDRVVLAARDKARLDEAVTRLGGGEGIVGISCDVADIDQAGAAVDSAIKAFGGLDILINSAGVSMYGRDALIETSVEDWTRIIATNLNGTYYMLRAALPHLSQSPAADIVNVQSTASFAASPGVSLYAASKFGVRALTEALIAEMADSTVRVAAVSPGPVATTIWRHKRQPPSEEDLSKMLRPENLAETVMYLLDLPRHVHVPNVTIVPRVPDRTDGGPK